MCIGHVNESAKERDRGRGKGFFCIIATFYIFNKVFMQIAVESVYFFFISYHIYMKRVMHLLNFCATSN